MSRPECRHVIEMGGLDEVIANVFDERGNGIERAVAVVMRKEPQRIVASTTLQPRWHLNARQSGGSAKNIRSIRHMP